MRPSDAKSWTPCEEVKNSILPNLPLRHPCLTICRCVHSEGRGPLCCENCFPTSQSIPNDCYSAFLNSQNSPRFALLSCSPCVSTSGRLLEKSDIGSHTVRRCYQFAASVQFSKLVTEVDEGTNGGLLSGGKKGQLFLKHSGMVKDCVCIAFHAYILLSSL